MKRRSFVGLAAWGVASLGSRVSGWPLLTRDPRPETRDQFRPTPTPAQLQWQQDELAMFCHFGVNTFTNREWGDGTESPSIFNPAALDCRQWARSARAGGFRAMILTAKHHDGFCLWPSATTKHSVASSPWRGGSGDLVKEFVDAARAEGLRVGLYLSPWDRNNPTYGDSPRYNDLYSAQLTELLTRYGQIAEVWFDGANAEGPNGKKQVYDWPRVWAQVRREQPNAVMFSDAGPDVRWSGNENGTAGDPNWSTVDPSIVQAPGVSGPLIGPALQNGHPAGTVWRPAECDTSIRPGWFYHPAEDARVKTVDRLVDTYFRSVGRNSKLLLNVPPTPAGLLHDTDVARLVGLRERLDALRASEFAARWTWRVTGARTAELEADLGAPRSIAVSRLAENIANGQVVSRYTVWGADTGDWAPLVRGTTIGYARLDRFAATTVRKVKVTIEDGVGAPEAITAKVFAG
jgi:alpha-L-fucosidase